MTVLVVSPHPDDEVLGVGGAVARFVDEGRSVTIAIVTKGEIDRFGAEQVERVRNEARAVHAFLGVERTLYLDFPAARLDSVPHAELNAALGDVLASSDPTTVFLPFRGDLHLDHRLVFDSAMVALRPIPSRRIQEVLAYETLSETNWGAGRGITPSFVPDCFLRLEEQHLQKKLEAMRMYTSQLREFPDERSLEALTALARLRGASVGTQAAEAFTTIRRLL